jgi:hypothetical protein
VEIDGQSTDLVLKPRKLLNDWSVKDSGNLSVVLQDNSDIKIDARGVEELEGPESGWKMTEVKKGTSDEGIVKKNGIFNNGDGKHTLTVTDTFNVSVQYP